MAISSDVFSPFVLFTHKVLFRTGAGNYVPVWNVTMPLDDESLNIVYALVNGEANVSDATKHNVKVRYLGPRWTHARPMTLGDRVLVNGTTYELTEECWKIVD